MCIYSYNLQNLILNKPLYFNYKWLVLILFGISYSYKKFVYLINFLLVSTQILNIMKVLITGSSGNLGGIITKHLLFNRVPVVGIDINESLGHNSNPYFKFYNCDIRNKSIMQDIFVKEQPTHVVHFASTFNRFRNRKKEMDIDFGGSQNVLDISNNTRSVKQLIYSSSAAAYGGNPDNEIWLSENQKLRPGKYRYGIIKKLVEEYYCSANVREELNIICLRICSVIGPSFNKPKSAISLFANSKYGLKQWEQNKVQFLHEEDMNLLITLILKDNQVNGIFNMAPDSYSAVKELIPDKKYFDIPLPIIKGIMWILWNLRIMNLQPASLKHSFYPILLDPAKLTSRYHYKFRYSTADAFNDTVKYLRQEKGILLNV